MTLTELRAQHPFPWRYGVMTNAQGRDGVTRVAILDNAGKEVPMFTALEFLVMVTSASPNPAPAPAAPEGQPT